MAQQRQLVKGHMGFLNGKPSTDLTFHYNPTPVRANRRATYASNQASGADFPNSTSSSIPAIEWIRNEAEEISLDLFFSVYRDSSDGNIGTFKNPADMDVEKELKQLDDFMAPDPNTGKPQDLVLVRGPRSDRCRILEKDVTEELYTPDLHVQQAKVTLKLKLLRSRSA